MFTFWHQFKYIDTETPAPHSSNYKQYKKEQHKAIAKDVVASIVTVGVIVAGGMALKSALDNDKEN